VDRAAFERLVAEALSDIPEHFRQAMKNIAILVEDEPSPALLREMEIHPPDTLFGLYQGTPLTERDASFGNRLPDQIVLFQGPHEREAEDHEDLIVSVAETLIHEIGHYFGMSEEEIEEVEEHYWHSFGAAGERGDGGDEDDGR
jgi:predicted Zn-dependent protease with MMP-like domain